MADQIDIDQLVRQLEQLVPALNSLSGTRAQNNQTGGDELKKGFDRVVRSIGKLSASLDKNTKTEEARTRSTEEFIRSVDDASDALDELTKAQKEAERQAQAQLDAIEAENAARLEAAKIARMTTEELKEKARQDKLSAAQSYADSQKQRMVNKKGTESANAMLEELGRIPHGTAALRERFEGLGGSSMGATVGLKLTTAALEGMVQGLSAYGSALYKGEIGAKTAAKGTMTFVKAVAGAAKAIGAILLLVPGFQVLGAGLLAAGFAAEKFAEYTEAAAEMSDNLYNSFQQLQKTGVIGAGAMSEVAESARRLNLGIDAVGLQKFGKLMEESSESLAMLGGSAIRGRKAFVEVGEQLTHGSTGKALMNMGMSIEAINEGTATYLALQAQTGQGQRKTTQQLQQGAMAYLKEMDGLAKLTGIQRRELEANIMKARSVEQFRAKVNAMRASGDAKQIAAADEMEKTYAVLAKQAPDVAQGFAEAASGLITSDAGRRFFMGIDRNSNVIRGLTQEGMSAEEALGGVYRAADKTTKEFNTLAQAGAAGDVIGNFGQMSDLGARSGQDMKKTADEIRATQEQQMAGADEATAAQTDMRMAQMETRDSLQNLVNVGVAPATKALDGFSSVVNKGTSFLAKALGLEVTIDPKEREQRQKTADAQDEANLKQATMMEKASVHTARAVEKVGYGLGWLADKVGLEKLGGAIKDATTESQEARVQRDREYLQKTGRQAAQVMGGGAGGGAGGGGRAAGGPQGAAPTFGGGAVGGGGVGPVRGAAAGPPGGRAGVDSLFNFGSGTGSQAHFNKLDPGFQQNLISMAQEYNQLTGRKLQVNSAYRSPEEQARINSGGNPKAAPGMSKHNRGMAVDLNSNETAFLEQQGLLAKYGFKSGRSFNDPPHIFMRDGGIIPARPGGVQVTAAEAGQNEAFVPLPDGRNIPVEIRTPYQVPSAQQIREAYAAGDNLRNMSMIPGMNIQDERSWAIAGGSIADRLDLSFRELLGTNRGVQAEVEKFKAQGGMSVYDYLGFLMRTPEGKVWAAQNDFGRIGDRARGQPEEEALRRQYDDIRQRINMQDRAALAAGKNIGGSIEDPLTRMEVLAQDYLERQTQRMARGMGNVQTGDSRDPRLTVINEQVIAELRKIDQQFRDMPKMANGGIANRPSIVGEAGPEAVLPIGKVLPVTMRPDPFPALEKTLGQGLGTFTQQIQPLNQSFKTFADREGIVQRMLGSLREGIAAGDQNVRYEVNGQQVSRQEYEKARADMDSQFKEFTKDFGGMNNIMGGMLQGLNQQGTALPTAFDTIQKAFQNIGTQTSGLMQQSGVTKAFQDMGAMTSGLLEKSGVTKAWDTVKDKVSSFFNTERGPLQQARGPQTRGGARGDNLSRMQQQLAERTQRHRDLVNQARQQGQVKETYKVNGQEVSKQDFDKFMQVNPEMAKMMDRARQRDLALAQTGLTTQQKIDSLKNKARSTEEGARIGALNDANMGLTTEQKLAKLRDKAGQAQFSSLTRPTQQPAEPVDISTQFDRINEQIKSQLPSAGIMGDDWMDTADSMTSDWLAIGEEKMAQGRSAFNTATPMDPAMRPGQNLDATVKKLEESLAKTATTVGAGAGPGMPGAVGAGTTAATEPIKLDNMSELLGKLSDMVAQQRTTTMAIEKMAQYQRA